MAKVVANRQVAHIWAHQAQDEARSHNGNFSFHGRKIYSYSTPVAHLVPNVEGELVALVTSRDYSVTTRGKHIGPIHSALGYGRVRKSFTVPFIGAFGGQNRGDVNAFAPDGTANPDATAQIHAANLAHYFAEYTVAVERLPRKRDYDRSRALESLNRIANPACDYAEAFGLPVPAYDTDADEAAAFRTWSARNTPERIAARAARAEAAAVAKAAREAEAAAARVERERATLTGAGPRDRRRRARPQDEQSEDCSMAEYHITTWTPGGFADTARRTIIRKRADAAGAALRDRVFDIMHSLSLRDTAGGWTAHHDGISAAEQLSAGARQVEVKLSGYLVMCERVA
jgi:hypothetical protein